MWWADLTRVSIGALNQGNKAMPHQRTLPKTTSLLAFTFQGGFHMFLGVVAHPVILVLAR